LQETLLNAVYINQKTWFPDSNRTREQIQRSFQAFVENSSLYLYCPLQVQEKRNTIIIWKDEEWKKLTMARLLQKGDCIRVALRLQGISYQMNQTTGLWTGKFYHFTKPMIPDQSSKPKVVEEQKCSQP